MKKNPKWRTRILVVLGLLMAGSMIYESHLVSPPTVQAASLPLTTAAPRAVVGMAQSEEERAADIDIDEIRALVTEAVSQAGGLDDLIHDGDVVVLKPNLTSSYDMTNDPQDLPQDVNGMTTDWRITQAVVEMVRALDPTGRVIILEGACNGTTQGNMDALGYTPEQIQGVDDFVCLEDRSGGWREYDSPLLVDVVLPDGVGLYPDSQKVNRSPDFYLNRLYYEADVVISLPVLKNHANAGMTGAVKNIGVGATPANIYGGSPTDHRRYAGNTINHSRLRLQQWVHDYYLCRPADFAIMDGLQGSQYGAAGIGSPNLAATQMNMRLILASRDAVALDAVACLVMGYDPEKIAYLVSINNDGGGCVDTSRIVVNGTDPVAVRTRFKNRSATYFYSDLDAPTLEIRGMSVAGDMLTLSLNVGDDTVKAEVWVDDQPLDDLVVGQFEDILLPLGQISLGDHTIRVSAYDRFLNASTATGTLSW